MDTGDPLDVPNSDDAETATDIGGDAMPDSEIDAVADGGDGDAGGASDSGDTTDAFDASDDADDADDADAADASDSIDAADVPITGPQLISSSVIDGEIGASRSGVVTLRFDRAVPLANFVDRVSATSEQVPDPVVMAATPCPDAPEDPLCVAVTFPTRIADAVTGQLQPATWHTIVISRGLQDGEGNTNDTDTPLRFSTGGSLVLFNDPSDAFEPSGLAYDAGSRSLFFSIRPRTDPSIPSLDPVLVYRIRTPDEIAGAPTEFADVGASVRNGTAFSELHVEDDRLFLLLPYDDSALIFDDLSRDGLAPTGVIQGTGLPAPNDSLFEISSMGILDGGARWFFGQGAYTAGPRPSGLVEFVAGGWSVFGEGTFEVSEGVTVAAREDVWPGVIFVASRDAIVMLSTDTGEVLSSFPVFLGRPGRLWIDSQGRLHYLSQTGADLVVYDVSPDGEFSLRATFNLEGGTRFAVSERGNVLTVYYMPYRGTLVILRQRFGLCDGPGPCRSSCENGTLDGMETAIDCGGDCNPCAIDATCSRDSDCISRACDSGRCVETPPNGCADETREGFVDESLAPAIAGCSGAWSVPGVVGTVAPACGRQAGNDGVRRDGLGCTAADLCSPGWQICRSPDEVRANAPGGTCAQVTQPTDPPLFFATGVQSGGSGACVTGSPSLANDVFGCGNWGDLPSDPSTCFPLDRFSNDICSAFFGVADLGGWACGGDREREGFNITNVTSSGGGVLCCRVGTGE